MRTGGGADGFGGGLVVGIVRIPTMGSDSQGAGGGAAECSHRRLERVGRAESRGDTAGVPEQAESGGRVHGERCRSEGTSSYCESRLSYLRVLCAVVFSSSLVRFLPLSFFKSLPQ